MMGREARSALLVGYGVCIWLRLAWPVLGWCSCGCEMEDGEMRKGRESWNGSGGCPARVFLFRRL